VWCVWKPWGGLDSGYDYPGVSYYLKEDSIEVRVALLRCILGKVKYVYPEDNVSCEL